MNTIETAAPEITEPTGRATYCPEDNKLRLYVGRVPRDEYEALRAAGWTSTPKQECDFVAVWTPTRRDTALDYAGVIEDEDQSPAERAADRAERFAGYREKRAAEANSSAARYEAGPSAFGFQSQARADRAAARFDRIAARAVDSWDKAEYWQSRTAGVISHALHVCAPSVRMGRIKELEAEIRKAEKTRAEYEDFRKAWQALAADTVNTPEARQKRAELLAGSRGYWQKYHHPDNTEKLASLSALLESRYEAAGLRPITPAEAAALYLAKNGELSEEGDWLTHYRLRLAYEMQMLEAQGGRAGALEIIAGGFIHHRNFRASAPVWVRIQKVNKSPASGRITSVMVKATGDRWGNSSEGFHLAQIDVERMAPESYRAPTAEELAEFEAATKEAKAKAKASKPTPPPLINPTAEDAERLQALWNEKARADFFAHNPHYKDRSDYFQPSTVKRVTQAVYSANSSGSFARAETVNLCGGGMQEPTSCNYNRELGPVLAKVRTTYGDGSTTNKADSVIILTDKPQKPLPAAVWVPYVAPETPAEAPKSYAGRAGGLSYSVNA